ncbi:YugN family protein [Caldalkalibacillus salinus]|uniref:YugN family protein n=1 Tax=Caldalkalibacillus salinus TaxID=2803787 RepID=UPI001920DF2B|nr:YugN family protein [Caldalkalibacillus salinus]
MYPFENTALENFEGHFVDIRQFFHEHGFDEGGNWEYDHGFFDKKLADNPGYLFIRVPVMVKEGEFGDDEALVRLGKPFLLRHKYQIGLDDYVDVDVLDSSINQFSEPQDSDASIETEEVEKSKKIIQKLEEQFKAHFSTT